MSHRPAGVLLVVALVSAGGAGPFTHVAQNRQTPRLRLRSEALSVSSPSSTPFTSIAMHLARPLS